MCVCVCALCPSQRMHQFQLSVSLLVFLLLRFSTRKPATGAPDRIDLKFCGTDEAPDGRVLTWVDLLLQRSFKEFPSVQCSAFGWISFCFKSLGQHTRTLLRAEVVTSSCASVRDKRCCTVLPRPFCRAACISIAHEH